MSLLRQTATKVAKGTSSALGLAESKFSIALCQSGDANGRGIHSAVTSYGVGMPNQLNKSSHKPGAYNTSRSMPSVLIAPINVPIECD
jgi:hypothetical protein